MEVCGAAMIGDVKVSIRDLRKQFVVSHSGIASIKSLLLFWRKRTYVHLEVLKGVSLDVRGGECVAVIGKNGAGKSTLLSLLARIYLPSSGTLEVKGRVAPLLELGAGFHNDLSGLENIYFNAVILGLTREQVRQRLDSIVEFSELGDAIEAPVRTYSSGMMARLGFAIAIHVDAEVLIVDEVLAVGDQRFEQKCLERVEQFRRDGGAILLVSHQLPTVEKFADRVVWLKDGLVEMEGEPASVIAEYVRRG
ncbi:MAG: ABC transporter ATP-binding protein [Fimbriimonas sp.]|jgi:ABC-type polysaccharide/polyol phosphate transport system ATPase subunit|nr:ABC transporter ATP-binding protein [Fimbriimonas sp.]